MLGAIIGDIVGSVHEFKGTPTKTKNFGPLFVDNAKGEEKTAGLKIFNGGHGHKAATSSHFTDDTVCTIGVARWLLDRDSGVEYHLRKTCQVYPRCGYGGMFSKWVMDDSIGPYDSWGNGAPMRVSPVGWAAESLQEAYELAKESAEVTHGHPRAVKGARAVAGFIYLVRNGYTKEAAIDRILDDLDGDSNYYRHILDQSLDEIRPSYYFKVSSKDTVPQALLCVKEGADFEDVIRNAISLGGDADTLAAIAGSMAEALYGIPDDIAREGIKRLPDDLRETLKEFSERYM